MGKLGLNTPTRRQLEQVLACPEDVRQLKRAQALLWVEEGEPVSRVAEHLRVSRQSIHNWVNWLKHRNGRIVKRIEDQARSGRPRTKSDMLDEEMSLLLQTDPSAFGYQATGWTNPLLRDYYNKQHRLNVSHQTVRQAIQCAGYRWKRPRYVLSRRPKHWRQAKGGLKKGLKDRKRTMIVMADATIITETPPLRAAYAPIGEQAVVPITGNRDKRVVFGAISIFSGHLELMITTHWEALTWQAFLYQIRGVWRGWNIVMFIDQGSPHTAEDSQDLAKALRIEIRWLPVATPELNAMEGLWGDGKDVVLANRPTSTIDKSADTFCLYLLGLSPKQRLQKAGILSGNFWLTN
ncbi:MAG: hypothetical protein A3F84_20250 [Candidatus Handelsmanbacteria bacterium RIFCSPLOWO2_12_FULL_64_10]|uniref:Tc1-like transposase DDE domain-containing protein n=1 Tax=Handelsmanbacteria sp. (strain RIFCSPLOWO2_12_FULL_64_10) TaxID=1817868 RepID=A0A1F6C3P6_HANXR|nr:MAG: hypothetical protein A3F84_20250 [Candidatus Handelsmanbacteria bacterium RIFCSPLOWO2_12_FULL_64_10]